MAQELGQLPAGPLTKAMQAEIERQIGQNIPPGKRGALVAVVDKNGVATEVTAALDDDGDWKLAGNAGVQWGGKVHGKVILSGTW